MRFNTRRLLLAMTTLALICGYFAWQRRLERLNYVLYDSPGPVAEREYWPTLVSDLVAEIENEYKGAVCKRVYRNYNNRHYGYCDVFTEIQLSAEDYKRFVDSHDMELLEQDDFRRARFNTSLPAEWASPNDLANEQVHGTYDHPVTSYGIHLVSMHDPERNTMCLRIKNDS